MVSDKVLRHILRSVEVSMRSWIERECRVNTATDIAPGSATTDVPVRPSSNSRGTRYVAGIGLEEIKFVDGGTVNCPGEGDQEHQEEATSDQDEGDEREKAANCHYEG